MYNTLKYPFSYDEASIEVAAGEIALIASQIKRRPVLLNLKVAACKFCGQLITLSESIMDTFDSTDDAIEYATEHCTCQEAKAYVDQKHRHEQAVRERMYNLMEAENVIEAQFGRYSDFERPVSPEVLKILLDAAAMIYDGGIKNMTVSVNAKIKAIISQSSKGKLLIERKESDTSRMEIG